MSGRVKRLSRHARQRQADRGITNEEVELAVRFGRRIPQAGNRAAYLISAAEVTFARRRGVDISEQLGTVVVLAADRTVVTVIRSLDEGRLRRWGW